MSDNEVPGVPGRVPGTLDLLLLYAAALLYTGYLGGGFAAFTPFWGITLFTLALGAVPIAYARLRRMDLPLTFPLRVPAGKAVSGALGMTAGLVLLALFATGIIALFFPSGLTGNEEAARALSEMPLWMAVIAVGLVPGACEEILFRGFMLSGLGRLTGKWRAIAISSVLFGILHHDPARIPITAAVGLALGYAAWETRSLVLPAAMHGLYNVTLLGLSRLSSAALTPETSAGVGEPGFSMDFAPVFGILVPLALLGAFLVRRGASRLRSAEAAGPPSTEDGFSPGVFRE